MKQLDWLLVALCAMAFCGVAFNAKKAKAHDPSTHQANSLAEARSEAFGSCCTGDDFVRIQTWETTDTGYRVMYKGQWLDFNRRVKVNNVVNPDGEAKAWIFNEDAPYVRCFLPGTLG